MAQTQSTTNELPLLPEGWHLVQVLTATRKDSQFGVQLGLTFRLLSDGTNWPQWLSVPKGGGIPTKHMIAKLIAAGRGIEELAEGESFDDEIEPIGKVVMIESKHGVKGAKSKNAGAGKWDIVDIKPAPAQKISDEEVVKIKTAIKVLYSDVPESEIPVKAESLIKKALKVEEAKKVSDLSPDEAKLVKGRIEVLAESSGKIVDL